MAKAEELWLRERKELDEPLRKDEKMAQLIKDYARAKVHHDNVPLEDWKEYVELRKRFHLPFPIREY